MTIPASTRKTDGGRIPGPADVPGVVEIALVFSLPNGKTIKNFLHGGYSGTASAPGPIAQALFGSIGTAWTTNLAPHMHTGTHFNRVETRDMASHLNAIFLSTGTAIPGTGTADALPPEAAVVMTEQVNTRGKGLKGRVYLSGWDESAGSGVGIIDPAVVSAVTNFGLAVFNAITAEGLIPVVAQVARRLSRNTFAAIISGILSAGEANCNQKPLSNS